MFEKPPSISHSIAHYFELKYCGLFPFLGIFEILGLKITFKNNRPYLIFETGFPSCCFFENKFCCRFFSFTKKNLAGCQAGFSGGNQDFHHGYKDGDLENFLKMWFSQQL